MFKKVLYNIKKMKKCGGGGGQGGCEQRIEVFGKFTNSGGGQVGGSGWWGGGVRVDVNAMLGVGGDVGM